MMSACSRCGSRQRYPASRSGVNSRALAVSGEANLAFEAGREREIGIGYFQPNPNGPAGSIEYPVNHRDGRRVFTANWFLRIDRGFHVNLDLAELAKRYVGLYPQRI